LGGGTIYATRDFLSSQASETKFIPLNQASRTALNAAGGNQFVFGGSVLTNVNGNTDTGDDIFSFSQGNAGDVQLILTYSNAPVVGYFTDNTSSSTGPNAPILTAGYVPLHITDITTQDLTGLRILMIDESDNSSVSAALMSRLPAIQSWVAAGGRLVIHDRSAGNVTAIVQLAIHCTPEARPSAADRAGIFRVTWPRRAASFRPRSTWARQSLRVARCRSRQARGSG